MVHVKHWRVDPPTTSMPKLVVTFDRPMDHALARPGDFGDKGRLARCGRNFESRKNETEWRFTPAGGVGDGRSILWRSMASLEDLAGNRPGKMFDVDTADLSQGRPRPWLRDRRCLFYHLGRITDDPAQSASKCGTTPVSKMGGRYRR